MQEHEYMYEHEHEQTQHPLSESELTEDPSGHEREQVEEQGNGEIADQAVSEIDELMAEMRDRRVALRMGRCLVMGLVLSFLVCVATFWLSGTLLSAPTQLLPIDFLQMLAANRILVLCIPIVCLVACYLALRSLTAEIMAVPERYLDERQKMLRDQAHRSAFKLIKFSSVLIPIAFILPHLPWFNSPAPVAAHPSITLVGRGITVFNSQGEPRFVTMILGPGPREVHWHLFGQQAFFPGESGMQPVPSAPLIQSASSLEIALAGGLLLVALLLIISALPMAALAWKGKA